MNMTQALQMEYLAGDHKPSNFVLGAAHVLLLPHPPFHQPNCI